MTTAYSRESAISRTIDRLEQVVAIIDENDPDGRYTSLNDARHAVTTAIEHIEAAMKAISAETREHVEFWIEHDKEMTSHV